MVFNLSQNELEASYRNYNQIDEDVLKRPSETIDYQEKVNIYLQIELNSFVNLIAENIDSSSINYGNKLESLEITSDKQYQSENQYIVEGNVQIKQNNPSKSFVFECAVIVVALAFNNIETIGLPKI